MLMGKQGRLHGAEGILYVLGAAPGWRASRVHVDGKYGSNLSVGLWQLRHGACTWAHARVDLCKVGVAASKKRGENRVACSYARYVAASKNRPHHHKTAFRVRRPGRKCPSPHVLITPDMRLLLFLAY